MLVPVTLADSAEACWSAPEAVTKLAKDPAAASRALDPGAELDGLGKVRGLVSHPRLCDAASVGEVIEAATLSTPGEPHTVTQARVTFAVAAVLDDKPGVPRGLEPYVARMLADHMVDTARAFDDPVLLPGQRPHGPTAPEPAGTGKAFWAPNEPHVAFEYRGPDGASPDIVSLVGRLAQDPEAFAILYDAERAYLATLLEHVAPDQTLQDEMDGYGKKARKTGRKELDSDLSIALADSARRVGRLMELRAGHALGGEIPDLGAFDREVRRRLKGSYRPAPHLVRDRPLTGDIVRRGTSGKLTGDIFDGRQQLFRIVDTWARDRQVPARTVTWMRAKIEDSYLMGMQMQRY